MIAAVAPPGMPMTRSGTRVPGSHAVVRGFRRDQAFDVSRAVELGVFEKVLDC